MACLGNDLRSFCHFGSFSQVLHCRHFINYEGYSISFMWFLPTSSRYNGHVNFNSPIHIPLFPSLIPRISILTVIAAATAAKSLQSCLTLCDPTDDSPPGSAVPGILQARPLEWVAISFSNAWKWKVKVKSFSCVWLFSTPWTAAHQAPPSMGFSRQEYWSGVPLPSPSHCH